MSRVYPTDDERWAVRVSIGKKITRLSKKNYPTRKPAIQKPIAKKSKSSQQWQEGMIKFITESKRQTMLDAQTAREKIEQWQRQTCAMFDMLQQHIVQNLQDESNVKSTVNGVKLPPKPPAIVNKSGVKTPSASVAKKLSAIVKKATVTVQKPIKTFMKKAAAAPPPPAPIVKEKKSSTTSIKRNAVKSSKPRADSPAKRHVNSLPNLDAECSREQTPQKTPVVSDQVACPSMPILQTDETGRDDNLNAFLKSPIAMTLKPVIRRRSSDLASTSSNDLTARKKSMPAHSSLLAIRNKSPKIVLPMATNVPKITESIRSSSAPAVEKAKIVRKIFEKEPEPEPIPNILNSNSPEKDDVYAKFKKLVELTQRNAQNAAQKEIAANGKTGDAADKLYPIEDQSTEL